MFTKLFAKIDQAVDIGDITKERARVIAEGGWVEDDDYRLPIVNIDIFWSYFSGLNIAFCKGPETYFTVNCREQEIYNENNNHFMTKKDKHTKKLAQELANYVEFKTRDIYRELLKKSTGNIYIKSANFPEVDCMPLTRVKDDNFIEQSRLIPVVLENHTDILSIPIQKRVLEPETLDTIEDTEHGTLFSQITRPTTKYCRDYEGINKLLMANYVKIFEVIRNHENLKQDMPNVWLIADDNVTQMVLEFEPDLGFQFIISHKKRVIMSINRRRSFTSLITQAGLEECIRAELEYHTGEYLSYAFEVAVKDIMRSFKNTGDAINGGVGFVSWEIGKEDRDDDDNDTDDDDNDTDDDDNDTDGDDNNTDDDDNNTDDDYIDDENDNDMDDDNDADDDGIDNIEDLMSSIARDMAEINTALGDLHDDDDDDGEDDDDDDNGNENGDDYNVHERIQRFRDNDTDDYYDDTIVNVRVKLTGGSNYFWDLQSGDEYPFRTSSFGLLLCIVKELETRKSQESTALHILSKIEQFYSSPKQKSRNYQAMSQEEEITIRYTPGKCPDTPDGKARDEVRVIIDINDRKLVLYINKLARTVEHVGLLSDVIFDRVLSKWSPFTTEECMVCNDPGGFTTRCCGNRIHGSCAHKWCVSCAKRHVPVSCPMCRAEAFL